MRHVSIHQLAVTGTPDGTKFLRDDGTWADPPAGGSGGSIDDLTDVDTTTAAPNDGDTLVFDAAAGLWVPGASAPGGGSAAHAVAGTATPGGSWAAFVNRRVYLKKITVATAGLLTNIEAYLDGGVTNGQVDTFAVALHADNSGAPGVLLAANQLRATSVLFDANIGDTTGGAARWFGLAVGRWVEPGDYWLAVMVWDTTIGSRLNYASGGADRYYDAGGDWVSDGGAYTITTTANNYSIRGNLITL